MDEGSGKEEGTDMDYMLYLQVIFYTEVIICITITNSQEAYNYVSPF